MFLLLCPDYDMNSIVVKALGKKSQFFFRQVKSRFPVKATTDSYYYTQGQGNVNAWAARGGCFGGIFKILPHEIC